MEFQLQHQSLQQIVRTDFRIDWFDLLAVQETLKSLLQHHNLEASILQRSVFFIYPEKMIIPKDICILMFTVALFTIARTW